jgi:hypothetical protein
MPSVRVTGFVSSVVLTEPAAVAAWLNVFVRKADVVKIACIAQSVNVISPVGLASFLPVGFMRRLLAPDNHIPNWTLQAGASAFSSLV